MGSVIDNYSKFEVCTVFRYLQVERVSESKFHQRLVSVYGQNVFSQKEVSVWCNKFKDGHTALNDDPGKEEGRQSHSHTDKNCGTVKSLIREDQGVKFCEVAEVTLYEIISDLNFHKVPDHWVLKNAHQGVKKQYNDCFI
jgi:hypothetical protein